MRSRPRRSRLATPPSRPRISRVNEPVRLGLRWLCSRSPGSHRAVGRMACTRLLELFVHQICTLTSSLDAALHGPPRSAGSVSRGHRCGSRERRRGPGGPRREVSFVLVRRRERGGLLPSEGTHGRGDGGRPSCVSRPHSEPNHSCLRRCGPPVSRDGSRTWRRNRGNKCLSDDPFH
jgi:hypothetical protein